MISFIVPVFNRVELISKTIQSILDRSKSYQGAFEIIIIDDCSSDDILEKLISLEKAYSTDVIKYHRNLNNYGVNYSRNLGISKANGDWVVLLDSDDLLEVELTVLSQLLSTNKSYLYFFNCVNSQGDILHDSFNREVFYCDYVNSKFNGEALFVFKKDVFDFFRFDSNSRSYEGIVFARMLRHYGSAIFFGSVIGRKYNTSHGFRLSQGVQLAKRRNEIKSGHLLFLLENQAEMTFINKLKYMLRYLKNIL